ncbi:MAG TPA: hypothetical protein ENI73_09700, partial [Spirochaetes bacterium]|nr:hypothetical protein [Spirochaetota bacterium]
MRVYNTKNTRVYPKYIIVIVLLIVSPIAFYKLQSNKSNLPADRITRQDITVMTYNLHFFQKGFDGIRKTIERLKPDLVALQEVLVNKKDLSKRLAKDLNYYQVSSSPYVFNGHTKWVLSFLSKKPIKKMAEIRLGRNRRAFRVTIDYDGQVVNFITVHLSPFRWSKSHILKANTHRSQLRQKEIQDLIRWIERPNKRTVLLGDFNSLKSMGELKPLIKAGFKDVYTDLNQVNEGTFRLSQDTQDRIQKYLLRTLIPQKVTLDY